MLNQYKFVNKNLILLVYLLYFYLLYILHLLIVVLLLFKKSVNFTPFFSLNFIHSTTDFIYELNETPVINVLLLHH